MSAAPDSPVTPLLSLDAWVAWVDRVGGQWASLDDLALMGQDDPAVDPTHRAATVHVP